MKKKREETAAVVYEIIICTFRSVGVEFEGLRIRLVKRNISVGWIFKIEADVGISLIS